MNEEKIETKKVCKKCGEVNKVNSENIKKIWLHTKDKETYVQVMYVFCERCSEKIILQVDDKNTLKLKSKVIKEMLRGKNKDKYKRLNKELDLNRSDLNIYISGLDLFDENEKFFIKALTNDKESDIIDCDM